MDIGIIGAGIAGLAAAIALRRAGHEVEIFEKSSFKNEIGAAILITPNGNKILARWGFDFEKAGPVGFEQFRWIDGQNLKTVIREDFSGVEARFGERMRAYHRVDLHAGLRELAEVEKEGWARPAKIRLGAEVVSVDVETGSLTLKDGTTVKKDLVVVANGCHCEFLEAITGSRTPNVKIGKSVYRWLAPMSSVKSHPIAGKLWENQAPGFVSFFNDSGIMMVTYPCRNSTLLNCAVFHNTRPDERNKEDWNATTSHARVLEAMDGFSDAVRALPQTVTEGEIKVYTVTQRAPSTQVYNGRVLAIGDTVHHMLPTHAQGGVSALEDAAALEVLFGSSEFRSSPAPEVLEKTLQLYSQLRLPRSATTQILSSTNPRMTMEGLASKTEEIRKFFGGELVDWPMGCTSWSEPIREFFYGYDVFEQAEKAVGYRQSGVVPEGVLKWFGDVAKIETKSEYAGTA